MLKGGYREFFFQFPVSAVPVSAGWQGVGAKREEVAGAHGGGEGQLGL